MDEGKRPPQLFKRIVLGFGIFLLVLIGYGAFLYLSIPSIDNIDRCFTTSMYKVELCPKGKNYVSYASLPQDLRRALVLAEDAAFYSHDGVDWFEVKESFRRNWRERRVARGGSTITQQLAKNLYLSKIKTPGRKIQEVLLALRIEKKLKKRQILEKYINVVEFGDKIYGIKTAAQHYFRKNPSNLNLLESIYLVTLLPNPKELSNGFSKKRLTENNLWRMKVVLRRMYRTNRLTELLYLYCLDLISEHTWPFPIYSEYDAHRTKLREEIREEFKALDDENLEYYQDEEDFQDEDDFQNDPPAGKNDDSPALDEEPQTRGVED